MMPLTLQNRLSDLQVVWISLPLTESRPMLLEAPIRMSSGSCVDVFLPPALLAETVPDPAGIWVLSWERADTVVTITCRRQPAGPAGKVRLDIVDLFFQPSRRRFPRVDALAGVRYWPADGSRQPARQALDENINLSGCGVRFLAPEEHLPGRHLALEIHFLQTRWPPVHGLGKIIRSDPEPAGGHWLALEIVSMTRPNSDVLVQFCLAAQFRNLQARVRTLGSILSPVHGQPETPAGNGDPAD